MIQSLKISRHGDPNVLQLMEEPSPSMIPRGVRIQVAAAGVNFADLMMRMGTYPEAPRPPFTPGYEVSGTVTEVGPLVRSIRPGDRVLAGIRFGGYSSEVVVPEYQVRKTPQQLSDIEAAAIPVNFMTAWVAIHEMARIRKGDRILIPGAAGGVGTAAVQIAREAGAEVIGLVGSESKMDLVKSLGASEVYLYDQFENLNPAQMSHFTLILDSSGGSRLKRNLHRLEPGGRIVCFGVSDMVQGQKRSVFKSLMFLSQTPLFTPFQLMMKNRGVFGLNMLQLFEEPQSGEETLVTRAFDRVLEKFESGKLKVILGKTFPLSQGAAAHSYLHSRKSVGKVVLTVKE